MFERFTEEARRAVVHAQEEARDLRASRIEPVHLLLALSRDPARGGGALHAAGVDADRLQSALRRSAGLDADALAAVGIDLDEVRAAAEAAFGPGALDRGGPRSPGHLPFTRDSKRALEESLRAVLRHRGRRIDSGHVLSGVLAVDDPTVTRVLRQLGVDADALRQRLEGSAAA
ncbi:Clp protease N-terminal domain-containing protein [Geodermatophilus sp. SYSU D00691]